jgi:hypothetical protein
MMPLLLSLILQQRKDAQQEVQLRRKAELDLGMTAAKEGLDLEKMGFEHLKPGEISRLQQLKKAMKKKEAGEQKRAELEKDLPTQSKGFASVQRQVAEGGDPRQQTAEIQRLVETYGEEGARRIISRGQAELAIGEDPIEENKRDAARIVRKHLTGERITPRERAFLNDIQNLSFREQLRRGIADEIVRGLGKK